MAFKKQNQLNPNQLTNHTRHRFLEFELSNLHYILRRLNAPLYDSHESLNRATSKLLTNMILPQNHELKDELNNSFNHYDFQNPQHDLQVQYFRYKNLGIKKIRQFVTVAPNDLVRGGKYDFVPSYEPIFKHWDDILPYTQWATLQTYFNIFREETLLHLIDVKETNIKYIKTAEDQENEKEQEPEEEEEENIFEKHQREMDEYNREKEKHSRPQKEQKEPKDMTQDELREYVYKEYRSTLDGATIEQIDDYIDMLRMVKRI